MVRILGIDILNWPYCAGLSKAGRDTEGLERCEGIVRWLEDRGMNGNDLLMKPYIIPDESIIDDLEMAWEVLEERRLRYERSGA